jgi:hypothetical protein
LTRNCNQEQYFKIHSDKINQVIVLLNTKEEANINDFVKVFSVNSEFEKRLNLEKMVFEGNAIEKADSLYDWVIFQDREKYKSLVLSKIRKYFTPINEYKIVKLLFSNNSYSMYEVSVNLINSQTSEKYYFQVGKIKEENYPILDIFDKNMISLINNEQFGNCQ